MPGPRYAADRAGAVRALPLDGLTAFYHRPSGQTHLVAPPAPEILDALAEGPADPDELLARIAARWEVGADAGAAIRVRLAELEQAGLVRRA